jgi:hypothetical protein
VGWLLGGSVGVGTVLYALAVGPTTQFFMSWFAYRSTAERTPAEARSGRATPTAPVKPERDARKRLNDGDSVTPVRGEGP